jgi:hypothetical protein
MTKEIQMKKRIIGLMLACVFISTSVCFAAQDVKGASAKARENASDQAIFNRVGDWFATVGKSDADREKIMNERRANRETKRVEKEARTAERQLKAKSGDAEKKLRAKSKDAEKKIGKAASKGKKDGTKMKESMMKGPQK